MAASEFVPPAPPPDADTPAYTEHFLNTVRVASSSGVTRSVNAPSKDAGNPLFPTSAETGEWDDDKLFVSVTKDGDGWHMHYKGADDAAAARLGYASSADGETWAKPNLGIVSYGGDTDNNIILEDQFTHGHYDATSEKWVYVAEIDSAATELYIYTADARNTAPTLVKTIDVGVAGQTEAKGIVRRPDGRWVIYYVSGSGSEARSLYAWVSDTTDLTGDWTAHGKILASPASTDQFYAIGPTRVGGLLYGLVSRYNSTSEQVWLDLYSSIDGLTWVQAAANWIDVGSATAWDDEMAAFAGRVTEDGDAWRVYYSGSAEDHATFPRDSRIGRANIDRGRVGQYTGTGTITTHPIVVAAGATLTVNADASGGSLDIEVQDSAGTPITNFAEADFDTISTDSFEHSPVWSSQPMPDDQTIILKFVLSSATVYGFEISDAAAETPLTVPGLISWLDASKITGVSDGATITEWPDETGLSNEGGNSINHAEPSYHTGVLNSLPVIRFVPASSEALVWVTPLAGPFTVFVVMKQNSTGTAIRRVLSSYDGAGAVGAAEYIFDVGATLGYRFLRGTDGAMTGGTEDTSWHYVTCRTGPSGGKLRKDGTEIGTDATAYSTISAQFYIGEDRPTGGSEYFDGDMAEVLFYDRELTDTEVGTIEAYLAAKYAL